MGRESILAALLPQLRDDLGHRRIEQGIKNLERVRTQIDALGAKSAAPLDRCFEVAQRLSGISEADVEELTKNSEATASAA